MTLEEKDRYDRIDRQLELLAAHQAQLSSDLDELKSIVAMQSQQIAKNNEQIVGLGAQIAGLGNVSYRDAWQSSPIPGGHGTPARSNHGREGSSDGRQNQCPDRCRGKILLQRQEVGDLDK